MTFLPAVIKCTGGGGRARTPRGPPVFYRPSPRPGLNKRRCQAAARFLKQICALRDIYPSRCQPSEAPCAQAAGRTCQRQLTCDFYPRDPQILQDATSSKQNRFIRMEKVKLLHFQGLILKNTSHQPLIVRHSIFNSSESNLMLPL